MDTEERKLPIHFNAAQDSMCDGKGVITPRRELVDCPDCKKLLRLKDELNKRR
jgi:hypothetical protein